LTDGPTRRGRPLRRALGWSIAFALLGAVLSLLFICAGALLAAGDLNAGLAIMQAPGPTETLVSGSSLLLGFGLATWALGVRGVGLGARELRWCGAGEGVRGFGRGAALGIGAGVLAIAGAVASGAASWSRDTGGALDYVGQVAKTAVVLAPAALSEEVMFRGLPLVLLAAVIGRSRALVLVAGLAFSLLHALNPNVTGLGLLNIGLAGLWLGCAFYAPGGIWTAFGAHLGWNASLAALDAPVSGMPFRIPFIDYHPTEPCLLSGCRFGPEGGLLATAALAAALLVARRWWARGETT
jgi:membrane protease YdiL (CAAX protease family)